MAQTPEQKAEWRNANREKIAAKLVIAKRVDL